MESPPNNTTTLLTVPVVQPEGTYTYIGIRGVLSGLDCVVFGMSMEEKSAMQKRFPFSNIDITNGAAIKANVFQVMNSLSMLGYKVVSSCGEGEIVWTLQREIN